MKTGDNVMNDYTYCAHLIPTEIALAADWLQTRRLNSVIFSDLSHLTSATQTNGGAATWFQEKYAFFFKFWNVRVESVSTTPVGCVANCDRRQTKINDDWLLISSKDTNFQKAVEKKNILSIKFRLSVGDPAHLVDGLRWPNSWCWPDLTQFLGYLRTDPSGTLICGCGYLPTDFTYIPDVFLHCH